MKPKTTIKHLESHLTLRLSLMAKHYNMSVQLNEQQDAIEDLRVINELESTLDYLGPVTIEKQPNRYLANKDYLYPIEAIIYNGNFIYRQEELNEE